MTLEEVKEHVRSVLAEDVKSEMERIERVAKTVALSERYIRLATDQERMDKALEMLVSKLDIQEITDWNDLPSDFWGGEHVLIPNEQKVQLEAVLKAFVSAKPLKETLKRYKKIKLPDTPIKDYLKWQTKEFKSSKD